MKAFIVNVSELFKLDTNRAPELNFDQGRRKLLIPMYQREYKWTDEKIVSLINDIKRRDKFIGNIILDETDNCYEIVDGQQRVTTCFLILVALYNCYEGHNREQERIKVLMKPCGDYVLQNDSIGEYIHEEDGLMKISISEEADVYYQTDDFKRAYNTVNKIVNELQGMDQKQDFKQKLLDCTVLVLINDNHNHTRPVEQLFLDINEKAQLLDVEDIFKGHCFEIYDITEHPALRELWVQLKKCGMEFKKLGYEDLSQFIYLYFLEEIDSNIPEKLTISGRHYLEGKTMDEAETLLKNMITYGNSVNSFYSSIYRDDYTFLDLCSESYQHRNTNDHKMMKTMCKEILTAQAQYQKLPLMHMVYWLSTHDELTRSIRHDELKRIIANLYVYACLFVLGGARKSKKNIDHTIKQAFESADPIQEVLSAVKLLRNQKVEEFIFADNYAFENLSFVYSVIDNYISNDNWITQKYTHECGYNKEHFIIPEKRNRRIKWVEDGNTFEFEYPNLITSKEKSWAINLLVIDESLNGQLQHDDIVTKIDKIKNWYDVRNEDIPKHVRIVIEHIERMDAYARLKMLKGTCADDDAIVQCYREFLQTYFIGEEPMKLKRDMEAAFKNAFQNAG